MLSIAFLSKQISHSCRDDRLPFLDFRDGFSGGAVNGVDDEPTEDAVDDMSFLLSTAERRGY